MGKKSKKHNQKAKFIKATSAAVVAASAVVVAAPAATEASTLKDINSSQYFYEDVLNLNARGIIGGFPDGTFKPGEILTRGQAAKIIAGVLNLDTTNVVNPNFKDIPKTHPFYGSIAALKQAGIIGGYEDGTFRQDQPIQRNHVAKILTLALNLKANNVNSLPFTDVNPMYKSAIAALYENNITTGKTATKFDGTANVTRGQMASFIVRAEKAATQEQTITFNVNDYTNTAITVDGNTYSFDSAVKSIFTEANKVALAGASVTAVVKDGVIKYVNRLVLNNAGTEESPVVFETNASIGSLVINANYVTVKNAHVTENATITSNVNSEVVLDGVTVAGEVVVDNSIVGALASIDSKFAQDELKGPKLKLVNAIVQSLNVKRDNTSIESNTTIPQITIAATVEVVNVDGTVTKITVESTAKLEITGNATIEELILTTLAELALNIAGQIESLVVENPEATVTVGTGVKVNELTVPEGSTAASIIDNYSSIASQITKVVIGDSTTGTGETATGQTPSTGGGSSSGGSGGSGGGTTPTPTPTPTPVTTHVATAKAAVETANTANKYKNLVLVNGITLLNALTAEIKVNVNNIAVTIEVAKTTTADTFTVTLKATGEADATITVTATEKVDGDQTTVTKAALNTKVTDAKAVTPVAVSLDGSDVLTTEQWTTQAELDAFTGAIAAAEVVVADTNATQGAVDQAVTDLQAAIDAYALAQEAGTKVAVTKAALDTKVTDAKAVTPVAVSLDGSDVLTTEQWTTQAELDAFTGAIAAAEVVVADTNATQGAVDQAVTDLQAAIDAYALAQEAGTKVAVTKAALNTKVTDAKAVTPVAVSLDGSDVLTTEQWTTQAELDAFTGAIAAAEVVVADTNATQGAVDQAVTDLQAAIDAYALAQEAGTKVAVTKAALDTKVTDAKAVTPVAVSLDGSDVLTTEQWTTQAELDAFTGAIAAAEVVVADTNATQGAVDQAVTDLQAAIDAYALAQEAGTKVAVTKAALDTKVTDAKAVTPVAVSLDGSDVLTTEQWTTQAELDAFTGAIAAAEVVVADTNATQGAVDQAVTDLQAAIDAYALAQEAGTKTAYDAIVTKVPANNTDGKYTAASWALFEAAIAEVNLTLTAADGQAALDAEVIKIQDALDLLELEPITYTVGNEVSADEIVLTFSKAVATSDGTDITNQVGGTVATTDGYELTITVDADTTEVTYTLTIGSIKVDVTMNWDGAAWTVTTDPVGVLVTP
ncbi:S-layer homology domain-containing protein [Lysinibacillus sp. 2017]|uniref:S-layer homology domain-containing protein n=3 Tax=unclassified Lysinibacillus TaxID=2636778 RepID=UPI00131F1869|nr:S-layer homology domain-containing protein [Lysinibacillus sp. 2017]